MADLATHSGATLASDREPVRVLRVIARMNVGGPAHHVSLLSGRAFPERFRTLLLSGSVGRDEGSFDDLATQRGAELRTVPHLGPEVDPLADARALREIARIARAFRPHIVHTHTAKAGLVGRLAAQAVRPRPLVVHTYHGHVLEGYFSRPVSLAYTRMEQGLARLSDRLIGVSQATVDDLVRLGVAPREKFEVVPLGLDLERFLAGPAAPGGAFREAAGVGEDELLATFTGRLVPIKRLDVLLDAIAAARRAGAPVVLAVVGDGPQRADLERRAAELGIAAHVRFVGYRRDLPEILAASDIAVLSSDNEGTPVSLIEAGAAARPLVSTRVGVAELAADPERRRRMGAAARAHVGATFTPERLVQRIADLYDRLLAR
jgi:glycosyltransferase involved in cell wall biosynthesis